MPKYTFLLPAFKVRFFNEMLQSLVSQTYTDFQVLISDDCSPEPVNEVCIPYLRDSRFTYIRNTQNIGGISLVEHWNLLLQKCSTEYVILASDDDIYSSNFLEEIDKLVYKYPETDLFRARVQRIDQNGEILIKEGPFDEYVDNFHFITESYRNDFIPCVSNYCYRTISLKERGGFVKFPLAWFSDDATNMLMSKHGCINTNKILFSFRCSDSNITFGKMNSKQASKKLDATILFDTFFKNLLSRLISESELDERLLVDRLLLYHTRKLQDMSSVAISACTFKLFVKYCRILKKQCRLDIKPLVYLFLRNKIKKG